MYIVTDEDREYLRRAVELAADAVDAGDQPFGSILVDANGAVLYEDRNRISSGDATRHPEFAIARWAAEHLSPAERATCTVYTSGEHCAMCSAAHAMVGLGRIVYAASGDQYRTWQREFGNVGKAIVASLPINAVAPGIPVAGPDPELAAEIRALHRRVAERRS